MGGRARIRVATGLVAGIVAVGATAAAAGQTGPLTTTSEAASPSGVAQKHQAAGPCDGLATPRRPAYGWPVKPFHRQHPVRGHFGDPRIGGNPKGSVKAIHFGVDVSAPDGTAVYATTDGVAQLNRQGVVTIRRDDGSVFAYWHIRAAVQSGRRVTAYKTLIGHIIKGWGHVHFAEYRGGVYVNPLRPGAMGPYADHTCPAVTDVHFERGGHDVARRAVRGTFDIVASAIDMPAMSAPAPWHELPVTPALVQWRIVDAKGRVALPWRASFDVRASLPSASYYEIYTDDTEQNRPDRPGNYRFVLARGFDAAALAPGEYAVQVVALDTHGNSGRSSWPLVISR